MNLIHGVLGNRIKSVVEERILNPGGLINSKCQHKSSFKNKHLEIVVDIFSVIIFLKQKKKEILRLTHER